MTGRGLLYLMLPRECHGLNWSHRCDAIEDDTGQVVVLSEELELILEGVFSTTPIPPLIYVLRVLQRLRVTDSNATTDRFASLRRAYQATKGEPSRSRHLGLLIGIYCQSLLPEVNPPRFDELRAALHAMSRDGLRNQPDLKVAAALTLDQFDSHVDAQLQQYGIEALTHWLKFGVFSNDAGNDLSQIAETLPQKIAHARTLARTRSRLVGSTVLIPFLDSAVTIPPRTSIPDSLPLGGYSDVTTRGDPDRLLLSQFALDTDDFVRRFAERELLYFRREEPHSQTATERVIVLDQGVRTWGGVRLALAAAVFRLLERVPKQSGSPRFYVTSFNGEFDLTQSSAKEFVQVLEASDLTANPERVIRQAIRGNPDLTVARDFVLLTHPRTVRESGVMDAIRLRGKQDRFFTVVVEESGQSELSEWTTGGPVSLRRFRVDLAAAEAAKPESRTPPDTPTVSLTPYQPWTGDIEPLTFPFRPGFLDRPAHLAFDFGGEWLLILGESGVPHGFALDGTPPSVLPRPMWNGQLLKSVRKLIGVEGGVVLCGSVQIDPSACTGTPMAANDSSKVEIPLAAFYNWRTRTVRVFPVYIFDTSGSWVYHRDLHCLEWRPSLQTFESFVRAFDLSVESGDARNTARAREAIRRNVVPTNYPVEVSTHQVYDPLPGIGKLRLQGNAFQLSIPGEADWPLFEPMDNGKPLLAGRFLRDVSYANGVLALGHYFGTDSRLLLIRCGPEMTTLGAVPLDRHFRPLALSPDGRYLAVMKSRSELRISETAASGQPLAVATRAALHSSLDASLLADPFHLEIRIGSHQHSFTISGDRLVHCYQHRKSKDRTVPNASTTSMRPFRIETHAFGHVVLSHESGSLIATFLVQRDKAAVWSPSGGFLGHPSLIGGSPNPGADVAIASEIRSAKEAP